jgi:hypothetical protein
MDPGTRLREARRQRAPRRIEIVRHHKRLVERAAARFVKCAGLDPFYGVDDAGTRQHAVLRIAGVVRIAGLVQRTFDEQIARLVARCRAAHRVAALDHKDLASRAREDRAGGQASEAGADHHNIIARH